MNTYNLSLKKRNLLIFIFIIFSVSLSAQEALKSIEEEYYDFLALQGLTERPTLNYRTFSDSKWFVNEESSHPWQNQNLGTWRNLFGDFKMRIYGPELFMSGNTAAPYGQNDGVLWQGRGFNASLKAGVRFEGYGIELTLLPHFAFSQNAEFEIMPSAYESEYGYFWGYGNNAGADSPQRFGNEPFFDWDFGDSEIRYSWRTLTVGFGTQAIWLGPSYLNSILHSNNAPAYPKFDIGLRRQEIIIPWLNWYIGDFEARLWVGRLSESDYFDSDPDNNHTMIHGLAFAYSPSFLPGLTLFANRICLVPWDWENLKYIFPSKENTIEDQKASFGFSWIFPQIGFEVYGELGVDDYTMWSLDQILPRWATLLRNTYHTMVFTLGTKKTLLISEKNNLFCQLIFEWSHMEMSQTFQFQWPYSFYFHHQINHGYTNKGQWLGNGFIPGGNAQYFEFKLFYPKGTSSFYIHRYNPDNNYIYQFAIWGTQDPDDYDGSKYIMGMKANLIIGISTYYKLTDNLDIGSTFVYNLIINPIYFHDRISPYSNDVLYNNYHFSFTIKCIF
ncbi:MAG: capsule assembly Wzi family protein [Treponema sp.]|nr:capsule assembly Wzi family protein [Treponema sp.]